MKRGFALCILLFSLLAAAGAPASGASAAGPQAQKAALAKFVTEFEALSADKARAGRRDLWLKLEEKFKALQSESKGDTAASAALYHALSRQELSRNSFLAADYKEAVKRYKAVASAYPKTAAAPKSLFRQASILLYRLKETDTAAAVLEGLIRSYPQAEDSAEARIVLAKIRQSDPGNGGGDPEPARAGKEKSASRRRATVLEQLGLTVQTIMLDAGHGGKDPGARASGIVESQFTLVMAKRIGALLQKQGFTVLYTRAGNTFLSLQARPDRANEKKADLFISIHVNANPKAGVRGIETYYLDEAKNQDAITVAARENGVPAKKISNLQFILTDLVLSSKLKESHHLAECVQRGILKNLKQAKLAAPDNGVRSAPFYVLMGARMPAILVEFGYVTNRKDAENLKSEAFLQRQAEGLVQGILQYKSELAGSVRMRGKTIK